MDYAQSGAAHPPHQSVTQKAFAEVWYSMAPLKPYSMATRNVCENAGTLLLIGLVRLTSSRQRHGPVAASGSVPTVPTQLWGSFFINSCLKRKWETENSWKVGGICRYCSAKSITIIGLYKIWSRNILCLVSISKKPSFTVKIHTKHVKFILYSILLYRLIV